jgi:hypothetical protein
MVEHLLEVHTLGRVYDQALPDEVFSVRAQSEAGTLARELESSGLDLFVSVFNFLRLERRATAKHGVQNYSDGPEIHLKTVTNLAWLQNFGGEVVRGSTDCVFTFSGVEDLGSEAEIANLEDHFAIQEKIA